MMRSLSFLYLGSMTLLVASAACGGGTLWLENTPEEQQNEVVAVDGKEDQTSNRYTYSEKMSLGYHNPVSDYMFFADPTAIEYQGRLYVYGTNDSQQLHDGEKGADNTFEKIHSFQVVSTEDMVNWTYHGTIDVKAIAPKGRGVSWAPSIVSRVESDGLTHFYMFFSSSGAGVGLLTSTHPLGPWTTPFEGADFLDYRTEGIGDCPNPFDPGVVIDDNGTAWLAFGGGVASDGTDLFPGTARICRLSSDMLRIDSEIAAIPAPYFFEASELNYIANKWIYIYNTSWKSRDSWKFAGVDAPDACSMCYMESTDPLQSTSWTFKGMALRNPGKEGMEYSNNHTHLHKYKGQYYMMYHTLHYQNSIGVTGGYRSICIDPITVNETTGAITCGSMSHGGVNQLSPIDGFSIQPASQASATYGITYEQGEAQGEMVVHYTAASQSFRVNLVNAVGAKKLKVLVKGSGLLCIRQGAKEGDLLAKLDFHTNDWEWREVELAEAPTALTDLYFNSGPGSFYFKSWAVEK